MKPTSSFSLASDPGKLAGRLWVLGAALLWSTGGLFAKSEAFEVWPVEVRGLLFAFWRALFASLVLWPTVRRPRWNIYLVPLAICFVAMNVTYLVALTRTTAANAIWLQSTSPWWVFFFTVLVLRQPVVRSDLIPLIFAAVGVGLILVLELLRSGEVARSGVALALASGMALAGVFLCIRQLRGESPSWLMALNFALTAGVLLPWILRAGYRPSLFQLLVLAGFGVVQMGVPYVMLGRGLRSVSSQEAAAISLVEPVLMPLWVYLAGMEKPAWWTVVGASLILAGLTLRYVVYELVLARQQRVLRKTGGPTA